MMVHGEWPALPQEEPRGIASEELLELKDVVVQGTVYVGSAGPAKCLLIIGRQELTPFTSQLIWESTQTREVSGAILHADIAGSGGADEKYSRITIETADFGKDKASIVLAGEDHDESHPAQANMSGSEWGLFLGGVTASIRDSAAKGLVLEDGRSTFSTTFLRLPVKTDTGDPSSPSPGDGDCYVNTFDNKIRCYADGAWRDLATW